MKGKPGQSRVRETAPTYGEAPADPVYPVTMADRGRLVLPAEVRERLNIREGDRLTLRIDHDGTMRLQTAAAFARSLRGMVKHLAKPGRGMVDELIAERRREAAMEERDDREFLARRNAKARR